MMDYLVLINSSRSLQPSFVISFVISLYLILQMCKDSILKTLHRTSKQSLICSIVANYKLEKKIIECIHFLEEKLHLPERRKLLPRKDASVAESWGVAFGLAM